LGLFVEQLVVIVLGLAGCQSRVPAGRLRPRWERHVLPIHGSERVAAGAVGGDGEPVVARRTSAASVVAASARAAAGSRPTLRHLFVEAAELLVDAGQLFVLLDDPPRAFVVGVSAGRVIHGVSPSSLTPAREPVASPPPASARPRPRSGAAASPAGRRRVPSS